VPAAAAALAPVATLVVLAGAFAGGRFLAGRLRNFSILDVFWTYGFIVAAGLAAGLGRGWGPRRLLAFGLVTLWSLRLGTHVLLRVARAHPHEDPRYGQWRRAWGPRFPSRMTWFFQLQAGSVVLLSLPLYITCANGTAGFSPAEMTGAAIVLVGIGGEALADHQLAAFRRHAGPGPSVCRRGLWSYSRHPNYFFEWVTWLGLFCLGMGSPGGAWGFVSPALILYFLLGVTGIPMTERQSLASRGEVFRDYQKTTSPFIPWFRKSG
jgi:steroid 5-alpha reductase family enzyme